jgi:hypothetical protein
MISVICSGIERGLRASARLLPSWRLLRVTAYFACISAVPLLLSARGLYAATREDAFSIGHELLGLSDITRGAETLALNGERFHHAVAVSSAPLTQVLDRIVGYCEQHPGPATRALDDAARRDPRDFTRHAPPGAMRKAVFREQREGRGLVLCFVDGPENESLGGWLTALHRFSTSHDLSAFGRFRYSFAEESHGQTRVVTLWADTGLNLSSWFPAAGDAPGTDSSVLPRPPNARRTLSASAEGLPFAVRGYQSSQTPEQAQRFYDAWMSQHGWQAQHDAATATSSYLRDDGLQAFLSFSRAKADTYITITETGRGDTGHALELESEP